MSERQRILLFAGGSLGEWALREIQAGDLLVGVDRGALFLVRHGLLPDLAIGDFDSVSADEREEIRAGAKALSTCDPVWKDLTDTEMALRWAIEQSPAEIVLLGALGTRFDHTLANVQLLMKALRAGVPCRIVDEKNEVMLIDRGCSVEKDRFPHISLLPLSSEVTGITLTGFRYPLHQATLSTGDSLGISNVLEEETGTIELASGYLLVIKSMD
ncbi:thiamine diphosphokinase [Brevibacillus sp. SYP-B805]|uniref:thiamine diphosphokinase n=1 Tax=Brevibacillus sp. SYP-B805 TaxID=1578199 RepID=UPI0013E9F0C5|nr:thiamine diphosphokinase [Brevibacillus sp. SYP-B805]NGQ96190.1 thiamine diphosphokinase [Brevibacillus sp. SYP-B805]